MKRLGFGVAEQRAIARCYSGAVSNQRPDSAVSRSIHADHGSEMICPAWRKARWDSSRVACVLRRGCEVDKTDPMEKDEKALRVEVDVIVQPCL